MGAPVLDFLAQHRPTFARRRRYDLQYLSGIRNFFSFHPALRKEVTGWIRRILTKYCRASPAVAPNSERVERLAGGQLLEAPAIETEVYFSNLAKAWDQHYNDNSANATGRKPA